MGAKVYADRAAHDVELTPSAGDDGSSPELEKDVAAVAAWFEELPAEWQSYFDREAESGRLACGPAGGHPEIPGRAGGHPQTPGRA